MLNAHRIPWNLGNPLGEGPIWGMFKNHERLLFLL